MKQALAEPQQVASKPDQLSWPETRGIGNQGSFHMIQLIFKRLNGHKLLINDVVKDQMHEVRRALAGLFDAPLDNSLDFIKVGTMAGINMTDADQKMLAEKQVDLTHVQDATIVLKRVKENEGVVGEIVDLGNLIVIEAIFDRQGMKAEQTNKLRQIFPSGLAVVQPGKAIHFGGGYSSHGRCNALRRAIAADLIEAGVRHDDVDGWLRKE